MGSPYQSDSMCRVCGVCEVISNRMILYFSYYCKYGVLVFGDDEIALLMSPKGQNASRDGLVNLWERAFIICNTITFVKYPHHLCEHAYKARGLPL